MTIESMHLWARRIILILALLLVLTSVLLPSADIGWLRHRWKWFTYPLDWIESTHSVVNPVSYTHLDVYKRQMRKCYTVACSNISRHRARPLSRLSLARP